MIETGLEGLAPGAWPDSNPPAAARSDLPEQLGSALPDTLQGSGSSVHQVQACNSDGEAQGASSIAVITHSTTEQTSLLGASASGAMDWVSIEPAQQPQQVARAEPHTDVDKVFPAADEITLLVWTHCLYSITTTASNLGTKTMVQQLPIVLQELRFAAAVALIRKPKQITIPLGHHQLAATGRSLSAWLGLVAPVPWKTLPGSAEDKLALISDGTLVVGHDSNGEALVHLDPHSLQEAATNAALDHVRVVEQVVDLQETLALDETNAAFLLPAGLLDNNSPERKPTADGAQVPVLATCGPWPGALQAGVERSYTAPQPSTYEDGDTSLRLSKVLATSDPARELAYDPWRITSTPWPGILHDNGLHLRAPARPAGQLQAEQQDRSAQLRHSLSFHPEALGHTSFQPQYPQPGTLSAAAPLPSPLTGPAPQLHNMAPKMFENEGWKVTLVLACLSLWWPWDPIMAGLSLAMIGMQPPADPRQQPEARHCVVSVRCAAHELDRLRREALHNGAQSTPGSAVYALGQLVSSQPMLSLHGDEEHGVVQLCYKAMMRQVLVSAGGSSTHDLLHISKGTAVWPPAVSMGNSPPMQFFHPSVHEVLRAVVSVLCMESGLQARGWLLLAALQQMASMTTTPDTQPPTAVPSLDTYNMHLTRPAPVHHQPTPLSRILQLAQVTYRLSLAERGDHMCEFILRCAAALHLAAAGMPNMDVYSASAPSTPVTRGADDEVSRGAYMHRGSEAGMHSGAYGDGSSSVSGNANGVEGMRGSMGGAAFGVAGSSAGAGILSEHLAAALARDQPAAWTTWRRIHPGTSTAQVHLLLYGVPGFVMVPAPNTSSGLPQQMVFLDVAELERAAVHAIHPANGNHTMQPNYNGPANGDAAIPNAILPAASVASSPAVQFSSPSLGMAHPHTGHHPSPTYISTSGSQHSKITRPVIVPPLTPGTMPAGSPLRYAANDPPATGTPGSGGGTPGNGTLTHVPPPPPPIGPPPSAAQGNLAASGETSVVSASTRDRGAPAVGGLPTIASSPEPADPTPLTSVPNSPSTAGAPIATGANCTAWASAAATRALVSSAPTNAAAATHPTAPSAPMANQKRPVRPEQLQRWALAAFPGQSVAARAQRAMVQALAEAHDPNSPFNAFCRTATDLGQALAERQPVVWAALTPMSGTKKYRLRPLIDGSPVFMRIKKPPSDCWIKLNIKELVAAASCNTAREVAQTATASQSDADKPVPQLSPSSTVSGGG